MSIDEFSSKFGESSPARLPGGPGRPKSPWAQSDARAQYVGTKDAASLLGVSVSTVQKLVEVEALPAWRTRGGHRRIPIAAIEEVLRGKGPGVNVQAQSLRVLVVEDNAVFRAAYVHMFNQWGSRVDVTYAQDGAQALLVLAEVRPDVMITDLAMSPIDGRLLVQTIRSHKQLAGLKVVVVSGVLEGRDTQGFDARTVVYPKPLSFDRLAGYLDAQVQALAISSVSR